MALGFFKRFTERLPWARKVADFVDDLKEFANLGPTLEDIADDTRRSLMQEIIARQPIGHIEQIYGVKPSFRQGHVAIEDSWFDDINVYRSDGIATITIGNRSEHIDHILRGAPPHRIPLAGEAQLYFWWGSPHRWEAKDNEPPGPRLFKWVDHPGIKGNNFVLEAFEASTDSVTRYIRDGFVEYVGEIWRKR